MCFWHQIDSHHLSLCRRLGFFSAAYFDDILVWSVLKLALMNQITSRKRKSTDLYVKQIPVLGVLFLYCLSLPGLEMQYPRFKNAYPSLQIVRPTSQRTPLEFGLRLVDSVTDHTSITLSHFSKIYCTWESEPAIYWEVFVSELIVLPAVQGISWCKSCHLNISMWMSAVKKKALAELNDSLEVCCIWD